MDHACRTCAHFRYAEVHLRPQYGTCSHPGHVTSLVRVLIHEDETRCYRGMGIDDYAPNWIDSPPAPNGGIGPNGGPNGPHDPRQDRVIDERVLPPGLRRRRDASAVLPLIPIYPDLTETIAD